MKLSEFFEEKNVKSPYILEMIQDRKPLLAHYKVGVMVFYTTLLAHCCEMIVSVILHIS